MGAGQSSASKAPPRALHVLRVTPGSPASETNLEPYFDFVIGFKDENLSSNGIDVAELERIVESHESQPLDLLVWSGKSQTTRVVPIVPSREWSLQHVLADPKEPEPERKPSLLGLSMRMCDPEFAMENVWHVMEVYEGSPADSAGLVPFGDWVIGWSGGPLHSESDFYDVVEAHIEKPLRVYVYSYDFDNIREVVLIPNRHWGGQGLLGCVFGFGLLHRIPPLPENREPGILPEELAQHQDYEEQQLFVPADAPIPSGYSDHADDQLGWEREELEREEYSRNYSQSQPVNRTSSAYADWSDAAPATIGIAVRSEAYKKSDSAHRQVQHNQSSPDIRTVPPRDTVSPIPPRSISRPASLHSPSLSSTSLPRATTPTPTRPFGFHMNGLGIQPRTPSWDARMSMFDVGHARIGSSPRLSSPLAAEHDIDDHDDTSVADTDGTDGTGTSSLTSVD